MNRDLILERELLKRVLYVQRDIRAEVINRINEARLKEDFSLTAGVASDDKGDTQYEIDKKVDPIIIKHCEEISKETSFTLVMEGLRHPETNEEIERLAFPLGTPEDETKYIFIKDPIDGTRGLMYDMRSAWSLAGIAPNKGKNTNISDIIIAAQTELPISNQGITKTYYAIKGQGAEAKEELMNGRIIEGYIPTPSQEDNLKNGFVSFSMFFSEGMELLGKIFKEFTESCDGKPPKGKAWYFNDDYISSGGQIASLLDGKYRFVCDLRPTIRIEGLTAYPYDLCTKLIGEEGGVIITDPFNQELKVPLDASTPVAWVGWANKTLYDKYQGKFRDVLKRNGLVS